MITSFIDEYRSFSGRETALPCPPLPMIPVPPELILNQITAIQSISTNTSFGKRETSTQARAGAVSASKYFA